MSFLIESCNEFWMEYLDATDGLKTPNLGIEEIPRREGPPPPCLLTCVRFLGYPSFAIPPVDRGDPRQEVRILPEDWEEWNSWMSGRNFRRVRSRETEERRERGGGGGWEVISYIICWERVMLARLNDPLAAGYYPLIEPRERLYYFIKIATGHCSTAHYISIPDIRNNPVNKYDIPADREATS